MGHRLKKWRVYLGEGGHLIFLGMVGAGVDDYVCRLGLGT